jgi:hypothetical protein
MMAITNNIWMIPPALYMKKPNTHPITSITAMIYNSDLITIVFFDSGNRLKIPCHDKNTLVSP